MWLSVNLTKEKSTSVQVITWCHRATSHYLNPCWPRSTSPYGFIQPQWVKSALVQVMTKYHQATSCYLNSFWPSSMTPCIVTRGQWVKSDSVKICSDQIHNTEITAYNILQIFYNVWIPRGQPFTRPVKMNQTSRYMYSPKYLDLLISLATRFCIYIHKPVIWRP